MFSLQTSDPKSGAPVLSTAEGRVRCPPSILYASPLPPLITGSKIQDISSSRLGEGLSSCHTLVFLSPELSGLQTGLIQTPFFRPFI